jgi:hypothetical protein
MMDNFFPAPQEGAISSSATETLLPSPTEPAPSPAEPVPSLTEPAASTAFSAPVPTQTLPPTPIPTRTLEPTRPPPPTAAPIVISNTYNIAQYGGEQGQQRSQPLDYLVTVQTVDLLQFEFSVPSDQPSSNVILHILLDGVEIYTSDPIGASGGRYTTHLIDLSPYVSQGTYNLTVSPEGVPGGGNEGWLYAWGGTLVVRTNIYP